MRSLDDLIQIKVVMSSVVSLDRERIVLDPRWAAIADNINLEDPEQVEQALFSYLRSYILRQPLFGLPVFMPSTNGPSEINVIEMEEIKCH